MYITLYAESVLQCKRQFARSGQILEFHIFASPNDTPCTVPPGADVPFAPSRRHFRNAPFHIQKSKIFWEGYNLFPKLSLMRGYMYKLLPQNPIYPVSTLQPVDRSSTSHNVVSVSTGSALHEMWLPRYWLAPCLHGSNRSSSVDDLAIFCLLLSYNT